MGGRSGRGAEHVVRIAALLLAGGTGTRLYPASSPERPKQFLSLDGERSLLRRTADRATFADAVYAVTRERYAERVADAVPAATVLTDPGMDTGPALVAATHEIGVREDRRRDATGEEGGDRVEGVDPEPLVVCCLPTDHAVEGAFASTVERAATAAVETSGLVCVGVEPDRPATGYGYVEPAGSVADGCAPVARFREKPDAETASELVERGCLWNAGIFAWTPDALRREAAETPLGPLVEALNAGDPAAGFDAVPEISIDYAVLERTDVAHVVPASFEWDDLGTWDAVGRSIDGGGSVEGSIDGGGSVEGSIDGGGNAVIGDGLVIDGSGNVVATDDATVSVVGVDGLAVAAFDDRVLVVPRDQAERVRDVVDARSTATPDAAEPASDVPTEGGSREGGSREGGSQGEELGGEESGEGGPAGDDSGS